VLALNVGQDAINGERRTYWLLRPLVDGAAQERLRQLVLTPIRNSRSGKPSYGLSGFKIHVHSGLYAGNDKSPTCN